MAKKTQRQPALQNVLPTEGQDKLCAWPTLPGLQAACEDSCSPSHNWAGQVMCIPRTELARECVYQEPSWPGNVYTKNWAGQVMCILRTELARECVYQGEDSCIPPHNWAGHVDVYTKDWAGHVDVYTKNGAGHADVYTKEKTADCILHHLIHTK